MKCPICDAEMKRINTCGVLLDDCETCHGLWFDNFELQKLDETHEGEGDPEVERLLGYEKKQVPSDREILCPTCNIAMHQHSYNGVAEVKIDRCYSCNGVWLDCGELAAIRDNFKSAQEREVMVEELINSDSALSEEIDEFKKDQQARRESTSKYRTFFDNLNNIFRRKKA